MHLMRFFEVETIVPTTKDPHPLLLVEDRCVLFTLGGSIACGHCFPRLGLTTFSACAPYTHVDTIKRYKKQIQIHRQNRQKKNRSSGRWMAV